MSINYFLIDLGNGAAKTIPAWIDIVRIQSDQYVIYYNSKCIKIEKYPYEDINEFTNRLIREIYIKLEINPVFQFIPIKDDLNITSSSTQRFALTL